MIERLLQDLRYAGRTFRRSPGFTVLALLTIAIGVGATAAIFSVVNAVLLRPLPFGNPQALVLVEQQNRQTKSSLHDATPANFLDWRARQHSFTGLAAYRGATFTLTSGDQPERVAGAIVSANFFEVLGVAAALGRAFQTADGQPGAPRAAILGAGLWRQRFGGRPDVVGQSVRLNDELHTIVGVMPAGTAYPGGSEVWIPSHWQVPDDPLSPSDDPSGQRVHGYFQVLARLRAGVSERQARADMDAVAESLERDYPTANQNVGAGIVPLREYLVGDLRGTVLMLFAAVGLLLLIATANVSGLLIARATARHQEMAVRVALGATRGRLVAQLLTESVVLAIAGGAGGVLLAMWLLTGLVAVAPVGAGVARDVHVDATVLLFALAISAAAGLLFGLAPARQSPHGNVHEDLKQSARGASGATQRRLRSMLVVGEIALSLVLLVAAGLTIRSLIRLQHEPTGFDPDHVLTLAVNLPPARYPTPRSKADFWERAVAALGQTPGVVVAGGTSRLPLSGGQSTRGLTVPGAPDSAPAGADYRTATPGYFRAMGIPLLRGRGVTDADREDRERVAVVSQSMATRFWPASDPIGRQFAISASGGSTITVVGVVGDVHHTSLEDRARPTFYVPFRQDPWPSTTFVLRTTAAPATVAGAARDAIWRVDKAQPIGAVRTMDEQLSNALSQRKFIVTLLAAFGVTALALAAIGLYGVLAFIVSERRREIGVRMALGATARDVIGDVMGQGLRLAGIGVAVGLGLALAATRLLTSLLYGTSERDAATFVTVALLLVVLAAAASALPAFRASRVDPLVALRDE